MFENLIYLDNNATTRVDSRVIDAMLPYIRDYYGNPSSQHSFGEYADKAIEKARKHVAKLIHARSKGDIIFTSGATESINLALKGIAEANKLKGNHIVVLKTEHSSVLDTCRYLANTGFNVTLVNVDKDGYINIPEFKKSIRQDTILVSTMFVNNETGVIQPINIIGKIVRRYPNIFFLVDATAGIGKVDINVSNSEIDLLVFSSHKIHGPKGVGALYVNRRRAGMNIVPQIHGGGQESLVRSGTHNVPAIVGFGKACEILSKEQAHETKRITALRNYLESELKKNKGVYFNCSGRKRVGNVSNILINGVNNQTLMFALPHIAISAGSACSSGKFSHVLKNSGLSDKEINSSIRISFGRFNDKTQVKQVAKDITEQIIRIRKN